MSDFRLKVFQSVAKHSSFTRAAQELFISQPAVTKHIHELESEYKVRLFDRQGNKIVLTQAGELFLEHTEKILDHYKQLEYSMNLLQGIYAGELKLGASTTIAQYVIPALLGDFVQKFPDIQLTLLNGNSRFIEEAVQNHEIDLGIVEGIVRKPYLKYTTFLKDELVAVVNAKADLKLFPEEISLEQLTQIPLVLREQGSGTLDVIERSLSQHGIKIADLNVLMYLGSTEAIKRFLTSSNSMGIVSVRSILNELREGSLRIVDIPDLDMSREFSFVSCQGTEGGLAEIFQHFAEARKSQVL